MDFIFFWCPLPCKVDLFEVYISFTCFLFLLCFVLSSLSQSFNTLYGLIRSVNTINTVLLTLLSMAFPLKGGLLCHV